MGIEVSVHEAKTHLSRLLDRVLEGEEVVIMRSGKRIVRLSAVEGAPGRRKLGTAKGAIGISPDFDAPLPESVLAGFER
ncbi:MAG: type II toxin-antitoxin system Phd/YefM family antitoxin [Bryobacteraceae bacterium]|jgi:prevent-host-death family protein|nr:type II toxin-antitoxin system Phd/YefM family antitoxin [Bryobacteraceae bacterium]